jgi:hypothetical protein
VFLADYPKWVLKYKKKGTYVNRVKDTYYLYAAHSERIPGTSKVRRVSDGYLGRITEKDGFIPAKDKVAGEVLVYEYGLHMTALNLADDIHKGLHKEFGRIADHIIVMGILLATGGLADPDHYKASYLSVVFPDIDITSELTQKQLTGVERCRRMIADKLVGVVVSPRLFSQLTCVHAVIVNKKTYLSKIPLGIEGWLKENIIEWRL